MKLFADLIDAFASAEGPPPDRLWRFMGWALAGRLPGDRLRRSAVSVAVGVTEVDRGRGRSAG